MFEVIKIFVEHIFKLVNVEKIITSAKNSKRSDIGERLFRLYFDLNQIYINGCMIVDDIEFVVRKRHQYIRENRGNDTIPDITLSKRLVTQRTNLFAFAKSFQEVARLVDALDPETTRRLTLFLSTKINIINMLNGIFVDADKSGSVFVDSATEERLLSIIRDFENSELANTWEYRDSHIVREIRSAFKREDWNIDVSRISPAQAAVFEAYLTHRNPSEHLEHLKLALENFRTTLLKNFELDEVLIKVGDRSFSHAEPEVIWWDPEWPISED